MADTLRGTPIAPEWGWVVLILRHDGAEWFPAEFTVARTRAEAIARFDRVGGDTYQQMRKKGRARAVRCEIVPCTFGEDKRLEVLRG